MRSIPNYKLLFRVHAGNMMLFKKPSIPDIALGVGLAENLAPLPKIDYVGKAPVLHNIVPIKTVEDIQHVGRGSKVNQDNFPMNFYEGSGYTYDD